MKFSRKPTRSYSMGNSQEKNNVKKTITWLKKNWHIVLAVFAILVAFVIELIYTHSGEHIVSRVFKAFYYSLSLVAFEGGSFPFPQQAPQLVKIILWVCFLAAPLLTLTIIMRYLQDYFINLTLWRIKNHIVICGLGRNGAIIYDMLRKKYPGRKIVIIEWNKTNADCEKIRTDRKTWWLKKDYTSETILNKARINKAYKVYLTTNNDLANMNALMHIVSLSSSECKVYCHIGNVTLYSNIENAIKKETDFLKVKLFNGYKIATQDLFQHEVKQKNVDDLNGKVFVFLGFGRFGKMLYNHIIQDTKSFDAARDQIILVSMNDNILNDIRNFTWTVNPGTIKNLQVIPGDMNDYSIWEKVSATIKNTGDAVNIFSCRDNDIANINLAISLTNNGPQNLRDGYVFCRIYSQTPEKLKYILKNNLTDNDEDDVILFPMYEKLHEAFKRELFGEDDI
jgi:hypothetical protein